MKQSQVQQQFGANAAAYATSAVHARGGSLARLVELTQPQPDWYALDVAAAAGHTAFAFAPHVAQVTAMDVTPQMARLAGGLAAAKQIDNVTFQLADAAALPYANGRFHLVTCRLAVHHFDDVAGFMAEAARVLRPGGLLAVVDNVVPGSRLRGKKAALQRQAGAYVNAFEKLRDPSHARCLSLPAWQDAFLAAGFVVAHEETAVKTMDFHDWANRMQVTPAGKLRLRAMLAQAPQPVQAFLTPHFAGDRITFQLHEAIIIGRSAVTT